MQAGLTQIWQLSEWVFLWFESQKMGFQSERSQRSTSSFWHGTWHWANWFPTTTHCKCFYVGLPEGTAWSPRQTAHSHPAQHSNAAQTSGFRTKFWTMPPLFCLFTFAVIALRYRTTLRLGAEYYPWVPFFSAHLDELISHMDDLTKRSQITQKCLASKRASHGYRPLA